jgi:hypothetical protein
MSMVTVGNTRSVTDDGNYRDLVLITYPAPLY